MKNIFQNLLIEKILSFFTAIRPHICYYLCVIRVCWSRHVPSSFICRIIRVQKSTILDQKNAYKSAVVGANRSVIGSFDAPSNSASMELRFAEIEWKLSKIFTKNIFLFSKINWFYQIGPITMASLFYCLIIVCVRKKNK